VGAALMLPGAAGWAAVLALADRRARARSPVLARGSVRGRSFFVTEAKFMNDAWLETAADSMPEAIGGVEIEVHCEVARWAMSLDDVAGLAPGMVLDLQAPLRGLRATLRAGNRAIAQGELVMVGEQLALRLTDVPAAQHSAATPAD
jgi:flagellar motor switch/type III secretory pathway protein FliN